MSKRRLPKSLRKFLRKEKARIRKEIKDPFLQQKMISEIYQKIFEKVKNI